MKKYDKTYTLEEQIWRYHTFKASLDRIELLNKNSTSAKFGITKFADLTREEFKQKYLMKNKISTPRKVDPSQLLTPKVNIELPTTFDWRDKGAVTPVKDKQQCGSCWAFSVVENVESMWILAGKATNALRLSEQQVVDCDNSDGGCDGGDPPTAYEYIIGAQGIEGEKDYPYKGTDGNCKFDVKKVVTKISQWKYATTSKDEKTLQNNLVNWGPVSICVDAEYWQYYESGVMTAWQCAWINELDHCVQLVGYNQQAKPNYWIVRNSWNTDWGVNGFIYLSMMENTCGMTEEATTSLV